ncbi:MAG: N-acetylmuramoyl-L-alanine amidase, partial [Synechococcales bacterium]|nr:N-acetylmuramoyl-L-alanine amidase [Synechococcales bacterium]
PGHGGRDPGAIGRNGLREAPTVLDISQRVSRLLEAQGIQVVMTRTSDVTLDLEPRVAIARRANADLFVSIHANAISMTRPEVNGIETFYYSSQEGYQLAQSIQRNMVQATGMVNRGVKEARFYVIRNTPMPAVLVETGFVTGASDAPRLADPNFRQQMAEAIAQGILEYLR